MFNSFLYLSLIYLIDFFEVIHNHFEKTKPNHLCTVTSLYKLLNDICKLTAYTDLDKRFEHYPISRTEIYITSEMCLDKESFERLRRFQIWEPRYHECLIDKLRKLEKTYEKLSKSEAYKQNKSTSKLPDIF